MDRLPTPTSDDDVALVPALAAAIDRLQLAQGLIDEADLELLEGAISREETLGPILDPTAYIATTAQRERIRKLVRAGRAFRQAAP